MITKPLKKIGLICLGISSLCLVGCFHIPDEDWLPSRNKVKTEDVKNDGEVEQAINSLVDGFNKASNQWNEKNIKANDEINIEEGNEDIVENEIDFDENKEKEAITEKTDTGDNITD